MEKLELKEVIGYFPHNLEILENGKLETIIGYKTDAIFIDGGHKSGYCDVWEIMPALYPVSHLNEEHFDMLDEMVGFNYYSCSLDFKAHFTEPKKNPYYIIEKLYEWHIDIHDLIGRGLAVDKSTL